MCVGIASESFLYLPWKVLREMLHVKCYTADCIMFHIVGDITQVRM